MTGNIYHKIVDRVDSVSAVIAELDLEAPAIRERVVDAVKSLYEHFVVPAAGLLTVDAEGTAYYDLETTSGTRISGLALGLLATEFPALQRPPDDARLAEIDAEYGIGDTPERRRAFFQAWMADRANHAARKLLAALYHEQRARAADWEVERDKLGTFLEYPLPTLEKTLIRAYMRRRADRT